MLCRVQALLRVSEFLVCENDLAVQCVRGLVELRVHFGPQLQQITTMLLHSFDILTECREDLVNLGPPNVDLEPVSSSRRVEEGGEELEGLWAEVLQVRQISGAARRVCVRDMWQMRDVPARRPRPVNASEEARCGSLSEQDLGA